MVRVSNSLCVDFLQFANIQCLRDQIGLINVFQISFLRNKAMFLNWLNELHVFWRQNDGPSFEKFTSFQYFDRKSELASDIYFRFDSDN